MTAVTKEDLEKLFGEFTDRQESLRQSFESSLEESQRRLQSSFEESIEITKSSLAEENKKINASLSKKISSVTEIKWKREGNRRQFEFNQLSYSFLHGPIRIFPVIICLSVIVC